MSPVNKISDDITISMDNVVDFLLKLEASLSLSTKNVDGLKKKKPY